MTAATIVESLLALPSGPERQRYLVEHASQLDDEVAAALKEAADRALRANVQAALQVTETLAAAAAVSGDPGHAALAKLAQANARAIGLGQHHEALALYDEAAAIYAAQGRVVDQARSQVGKLWSLAALGRYDEALHTGEWASAVLAGEEEWLPLAKLTVNLAAIRGRLGHDGDALALLDRARTLYQRLGAEGLPFLSRVEHNRAIVLRNLGRFDESIRASEDARQLLAQTGQTISAARARQNLAVTYFVLGRYNEALAMLDQVRDAFVADGRQRDAMLVDLFTSDCLLQLRRFAGAYEKCQQARGLFRELGTRYEMAQALLNEAVAAAGMQHFSEAQQALGEARQVFVAEGNQVWVATTDLERANMLFRAGQWAESLEQATACMAVFQDFDLPVEEARACLVASRGALALEQDVLAQSWVAGALAIGQRQDIPSVTYQAHQLMGSLARRADLPETALAALSLAIDELERLRSRLMIEHRADFLEDKQGVYEDAVDLCLDMGQAERGLEYAERAKSRALLDLLAGRLDLGIEARREEDRPLVDELLRLRAQRDQLYRRGQGVEEFRERGWAAPDADWQATQLAVLRIEKQITELWHRLLVRNADYARDAALWQVRAEPIQPFLAAGVALIEYFAVRGQFIAFVVTADSVQATRLPLDISGAQQLLRLLWLNFNSAPRATTAKQLASLTANAQGILGKLHASLIEPLAAAVAPSSQWIVVPHGPLHYLPFHALHDGLGYLLESRAISYLPAASFLRYANAGQGPSDGLIAFGHSYDGHLPFTVQEARHVAELMHGAAYVDDDATLAALRATASQCRVLHLATHGDFRPDNPLFSGLALADGWLTTLDIFNLRLPASLVTLSACQTGRSVLGGGDELLGLMRAFLSAGASSLLLSQWAVEDRSTALLMGSFYRKLAAGRIKGEALRAAQLEFVAGQATLPDSPLPLTHPYFWAPFFLVGATDEL